MRIFLKLIGLALVLMGIYFLGQNIIFTTLAPGYWWRSISATGSVLFLISGIITLMFFGRSVGSLGWVLVGIGIALVFISGGVILRPTTLWTFFVAFSALVAGFQLITAGRVRF